MVVYQEEIYVVLLPVVTTLLLTKHACPIVPVPHRWRLQRQLQPHLPLPVLLKVEPAITLNVRQDIALFRVPPELRIVEICICNVVK